MKSILFVRLLEKIPHGVFTPPLGILYLISPLREVYPDIKISIFDSMLYSDPERSFVQFIQERQPDIVAFSINYTERDMFKKFSGMTGNILEDAVVIVGGTGTGYTPGEFIHYADFVVSGEGEERLLNIIAFLKGEKEELTDGISYIDDHGKVIISEPVSYLKDLDRFGIPAWDMVDLKIYSGYPARNTLVRQLPYAAVMTSRGCPFRCPWCHNYTDGRIFPYRKRSVENVISELLLLKSLGVREIQFLDDTFNIPEKRAFEIFEQIYRHRFGFSIAFQGFRLDMASPELLLLIRKAGGYKIDYGVQHVCAHITKDLHRSNTPQLKKILEKNRYARKLGFLTYAFFISGFPGETREDSFQNLRFADKLNPDFIGFFKLTPLPGTKYFSEVKEPEKIPSVEFNHFNIDPRLAVGELSQKEIEELQSLFYRRFYLARFRLLRLFLRIPKNSYLFMTIRSYLKSMVRIFISEER
ncbi:MAG: B12-binding domain-containing radical SAM protein [Candidatus Muiribacteriaceae bacterium]